MRRFLMTLTLVMLMAGCNQNDGIQPRILGVSQPTREQLEEHVYQLEQSSRKAEAQAEGQQRALDDAMGRLVAAYPTCEFLPILCGEHLTQQAEIAFARGQPILPGMAVLFALGTAMLWGVGVVILVRFWDWFVAPSVRQTKLAAKTIHDANMRTAAAAAEIENEKQQIAALRAKNNALSAENAALQHTNEAWRNALDALEESIENKQSELEEIKRRRDEML